MAIDEMKEGHTDCIRTVTSNAVKFVQRVEFSKAENHSMVLAIALEDSDTHEISPKWMHAFWVWPITQMPITQIPN